MVNLRKLKECANEIIQSLSAVERSGCYSAFNWGDLSCTSARLVVDDYGEVTLEVLIEEAAPEAHDLQGLINGQLREAGWHHVTVLTEW